uniref:AAA family ATPase n=1 Tax=Rheinheimera sp. TaxID=1869214 RepID=UPI00404766CE
MAKVYPSLENISRLKVKPTEGELHLLNYLVEELDDSFEVFFNPFLDGDRPDFIILKRHVVIFVIEVKDYDLDNYSIDSLNKWSVKSGQGKSRISSPQAQAFTYKKNLFQLHLPVLGLARLENRNFYNLVVPLVYMHKADKTKLDELYRNAEEQINSKNNELKQSFKAGIVNADSHNRQADGLSRTKKKLSRDKFLVYTNDRLKELLKKINSYKPHVLFDDRVYDDFKRRLMPSDHVLKQGKNVQLDSKQAELVLSKTGHSKIQGVAGCGKTTIMAARAVNAHTRHDEIVLIVTFNITLKNLFKDKISDVLGFRDEINFAITNYHQFFNSQLNAIGEDIVELIEKHGFEELYKFDLFKDKDLERYQTILVDEVQDFENEWVKILRDNFLAENGEMVLFGDYSQNIYEREPKRAAVIAQGFGEWKKLKRSFRTQLESTLNPLFKKFQSAYLLEKYTDSESMETAIIQPEFTFELLRYHACSFNWENDFFELIQSYIKNNNLNPNDIVILSSNIFLVRKIAEKFCGLEKTHCMFETYSELFQILKNYEQQLRLEDLRNMPEEKLRDILYKYPDVKNELEQARRTKKNHFYANSGLIKLSTVHSYKGLESRTVFYLMDDNDTPEVAYTSITRTTENLIIFDLSKESQFSNFFKNEIGIYTQG